jgi:hypothetical protein
MSDEYSLLDQFELRGYWWLPGEPGNRIPGILHYNPEESIRLELMGAFQGLATEDSVQIIWPLPAVRRPLILGTTDQGDDCTLFGVVESPIPSGNAENVQVWSNVDVSNLFLGQHLPDERAISFQSMYAGFTHLEEWLGVDPLAAGLNFVPRLPEPTDPLELRFPYRSRKLFETHVSSLNAVISLWSSVEWEVEPTRSLSLLHRAHFEVDAGEPRDYACYLDVFHLCRQLLAFLMGVPVYPSRLRTRWGEREIRVYRSRVCQGHKGGRFPPTGLPFPLIRSRAAAVVRTWLENAEKFRPVYDLAVSSYYGEGMSLQAQFLGLAQALEIFARLQGLRGHLPEQLRKLFAKLSKHTNDQIGGIRKDFIQIVAHTRDYLVHRDRHLESKVLHGAGLYFDANKKLRALLFVLLCKMLGIGEQDALMGALTSSGLL